MEFVGEHWDEIAIHVGGAWEAVEKHDGGRVLGPGFTIEVVESADFGGFVGSHVDSPDCGLLLFPFEGCSFERKSSSKKSVVNTVNAVNIGVNFCTDFLWRSRGA
jgi:hypothetical protein